jgi:hypothetical protein
MIPTVGAINAIGIAAALKPANHGTTWQSCPWNGVVAALPPSQPRYQRLELSMRSPWQQLCNPANHGTHRQSCPWNGVVAALPLRQHSELCVDGLLIVFLHHQHCRAVGATTRSAALINIKLNTQWSWYCIIPQISSGVNA